QAHAMLLRGTEGEPVADPRRMRKCALLLNGLVHSIHDPTDVSAADNPVFPIGLDVATTASYIRSLMESPSTIPTPIQHQVTLLCKLAAEIC
ncbi:MAG: DNA-binding protein YbiB, partial [Limnohabitans sp.]